MSSRKAKLYAAILFLISAVIILIVSDSRTMRITAVIMAVICCCNIVYFYMPEDLRHKIARIRDCAYTLLICAVIIAAIITTDNDVWRYFTLLYLALSVGAFAVRQIRLNGKLIDLGSQDSKIDITTWFTVTAALFILSFLLYVSELQFFQYILGFIAIFLIAAYLAYCIYRNKPVARIGYILTTISLAMCGSVYFNLLPDINLWTQYVALIATATGTLLFQSYICLRDYPKLDGVMAIIFIMLLIKGIEACYRIPEISTHIAAFFNS